MRIGAADPSLEEPKVAASADVGILFEDVVFHATFVSAGSIGLQFRPTRVNKERRALDLFDSTVV